MLGNVDLGGVSDVVMGDLIEIVAGELLELREEQLQIAKLRDQKGGSQEEKKVLTALAFMWVGVCGGGG